MTEQAKRGIFKTWRRWRERRLLAEGARRFAAEDLAMAEAHLSVSAETLPDERACYFSGRYTEDNCETAADLRYCAFTPSTTAYAYGGIGNGPLHGTTHVPGWRGNA